MCSIIRVGERLHKVWGRLTLAHWTQVSDRCPLGYLLVVVATFSYNFHWLRMVSDDFVCFNASDETIIMKLPNNCNVGRTSTKHNGMCSMRSLVRVFVVRMKKLWVLDYPL